MEDINSECDYQVVLEEAAQETETATVVPTLCHVCMCGKIYSIDRYRRLAIRAHLFSKNYLVQKKSDIF